MFFFFQAEDGIRDYKVTGVQTCALPILVQTEFRAQVPVRLEIQFEPPISREKLQTIPDLYFDGNGYLVNFAIPLEVVLGITDMAAGRKRTSSEPAVKEEVDFRHKFPRKFMCSDGHWVRSKAELLIDNC